MAKPTLAVCPTCGGKGTTPKAVATHDKEGNVTTETVDVDCATCDGSGKVVNFDAQ